MIGSGEVEPRPGVLRLMDEARQAGLKVAVCSAATKSSVVYTLTSLLGKQRFEELDCFLAGGEGWMSLCRKGWVFSLPAGTRLVPHK